MGRYDTVDTKMATIEIPGKFRLTLMAKLVLLAQNDHPLSVPGLEDGQFLRANLHIGEIGRDGRFYEGLPVAPGIPDVLPQLLAKIRPDYDAMARLVEERRMRLSDLRRAAENDAKGDQKEGVRHTGKTQKERDKRKARVAGNQ